MSADMTHGCGKQSTAGAMRAASEIKLGQYRECLRNVGGELFHLFLLESENVGMAPAALLAVQCFCGDYCNCYPVAIATEL